MLALNIDAGLTRAIAEKGWSGVPEARREGVGQAAPALPDYEAFLFEVHRQHAAVRGHGSGRGERGGRDEPGFRNFVESQLAWDRAMAEALIAGRVRHAAADGSLPLAVGIVGSGHVRFGHGIAHQLRDLGESSIGQLLPVSADAACGELPAGLADAVFSVPVARMAPPPPPRLGVVLEHHERGIRIGEVSSGSLAERSGLRSADIIVEAAGVATPKVSQLISAVRRQPPGTWLPLRLERGGETLELVVRFPPER